MENCRKMLVFGMLLLAMLAGCSKKGSDAVSGNPGQSQTQVQNQQQTQSQSQDQTQSQSKSGASEIRGIVTAITQNEITVAKNPMGMPSGVPGAAKQGSGTATGPLNTQLPQNQNVSGDGNAPGPQNGQTPAAGGAAAQGDNSAAPKEQPQRGSAAAQSKSNIDSSSWEKATYKIDAKTKIIKTQFGADNKATETEAGVSDIKADANVVITLRSGDTSTADTIRMIDRQR